MNGHARLCTAVYIECISSVANARWFTCPLLKVAVEVARLYEENDMPRGWMLPNDGYGCGYGEGPEKFPNNLTDLTEVVAELHTLGMYTRGCRR